MATNPSPAPSSTTMAPGLLRLLRRRFSVLEQLGWTRFCFVLLILGHIVNAAAWIQVSSRSHVQGFLIQVDRVGQSVSFAPAPYLEATDQRFLIHQLAQWIRDVRTIDAVPTAQRQRITHAYACVSSAGRQQLDDHFRHEPPMAAVGDQVRSIRFESFNQLDTDGWLATWWETTTSTSPYQPVDRSARETKFQGTFQITVRPPTSSRGLELNPLGLRIERFNWQPIGENSL